MEMVLQAAVILASFLILWFLTAVVCLDDLAWIEAPGYARTQQEPK